jgi:hypothetical protein
MFSGSSNLWMPLSCAKRENLRVQRICRAVKEGYPQLFNSFCGNADEGQFYELGVLGGVDFRSIPESENELKS